MSSPNQLSFLPDDYLERKAQRRSNVLCAALSIIVIGVVGAAVTITERMNKDAEQRNSRISAELSEQSTMIDEVELLNDKQRKLAHEAELSASLLEKVPRSNILAEVTNALPPGVSLLDFTLDSKKHPATSPPAGQTAFDKRKTAMDAGKPSLIPVAEPIVYDVSMKLTGVADTDTQVAEFIKRLSHSSLLKDVNLVVSDEFNMGDQKVRRFQLEMILDPNAEVKPAAVNPPKPVSNESASVDLDKK